MKSSVEWNGVQCRMEWSLVWNGMRSLTELNRVQCNEVEWNAMSQHLHNCTACTYETTVVHSLFSVFCVPDNKGGHGCL